MIPNHLHSLFWDVDLQSFDPRSHPEYTIGRILELGDEAAVSWLRQNFAAPDIMAAIRNDRRLSRRSATFWALVYSLPRHEVAALKQPSR